MGIAMYREIIVFNGVPVVNHPDYNAKINDDNKFPIKFGALANYLLKNKIVKRSHVPKECSIKTLKTSIL